MKLVKKLILTALIALGVGAVAAFTALAAAGFDINELDRQHYSEKIETVSGDIGTIKIVSGSYDIKVMGTDAAEISAKVFNGDDVKTNITTEGGTVTISIADDRSWYEKTVGSIGRERELMVFLPKSGSYALSVSSESGDIDIEYFGGTLAALEISTDSGDVELDRTKVSGMAKVQTDSGDVDIDNIDVAAIEIETRSGDVEGEIMKAMNYQVTTKSGRKRHPASDTAAPVCKITTKSGDVEIDIDD